MKKRVRDVFVPGLEKMSVTSAHMLMARIQSRDHTQLQGVLEGELEKKMAGGGTDTVLATLGVCL